MRGWVWRASSEPASATIEPWVGYCLFSRVFHCFGASGLGVSARNHGLAPLWADIRACAYGSGIRLAWFWSSAVASVSKNLLIVFLGALLGAALRLASEGGLQWMFAAA